MKKIDFQQLLLDKGERIGLCVAGGLAVILLSLTLFRGLFSGSASAHIDELNALSTNLKNKHNGAQPDPKKDAPPPLADALVKFENSQTDPDEYRGHSLFFLPPATDTKRHQPNILTPDEFLVTVLRGQFPALQVQFDEISGKRVITHIAVAKSGGSGESGGAGGSHGGSGLQGNLYKGATQGGGRGSVSFNSPPRQGGGGNTGRNSMTQWSQARAQQKPRIESEMIPVNEANGRKPMLGVLPRRCALVVASFPYKQQIDEFKRALRLSNDGAVLGEHLRGEKGELISSFQFRGLEVERMTLNDDGSDGLWEPIDIDGEYLKFLLLTSGQLEPDDPKYAKVLQVSGKLQRRVPKQLQSVLANKDGTEASSTKVEKHLPVRSPDLLARLDNIQKTLAKLAESKTTDVAPTPSYLREGFDPDEDTSRTGTGRTSDPMPPTSDKDPDGKYGSVQNSEWQKKLDQTPIEHCVVRFIDVSLDPGKSYKYRFKVRMMNPNYAPDSKKRNDTYPQFAEAKELKSEWAVVPQVVTVPPDQLVYALKRQPSNMNLLNRELRNQEPWRWTFIGPQGSPPTQEPSQAAVQIHRWVEHFYTDPDKGTSTIQPVGEWLVAARILVERGEFVRDPRYHLYVPTKPIDLFEYELANNTKATRNQDRRLMSVDFGDETVLVDFEGGEVKHTRTEIKDEKPKSVTISDECAIELLLMRPDGKVIAHNSITDGADKEREARAKAFTKRIEDLRNQGKPGYDPFKSGTTQPK